MMRELGLMESARLARKSNRMAENELQHRVNNDCNITLARVCSRQDAQSSLLIDDGQQLEAESDVQTTKQQASVSPFDAYYFRSNRKL